MPSSASKTYRNPTLSINSPSTFSILDDLPLEKIKTILNDGIIKNDQKALTNIGTKVSQSKLKE